jgi:hypothetical protein
MNYTPEEIDAMPNLARINVRVILRPARIGEPMFYYDSEGDAWSVTDTEIGPAKTRFYLGS